VSWQDKPQVKKGDYGELLVRKYLEKKGWIVYQPITDGAHYFDILATLNKNQVVAIDVKTKGKMNLGAQGLDIKHYNQYLKFSKDTNIDFYLIFVDDKCGDVHACKISKLANTKPKFQDKKIIAWDINIMTLVFNIGVKNCKILSQYDTRNYEYKGVSQNV